MTHLFMAAGIIGMAAAIFALGWQSNKVWVDWRDDRALRAAERHTHRKGDPQETTLLARAGRLPASPMASMMAVATSDTVFHSDDLRFHALTDSPHASPWVFAGGWDQGPATVEQPAVPGVDTPSDFERSMTVQVNEMIAEYQAQTNEFIHSMPRVIIDG